MEGGTPVAMTVFQREDNGAMVRRWLRLILHGGGNIRSTLRQRNEDEIQTVHNVTITTLSEYIS
jgi:hypothetical protein